MSENLTALKSEQTRILETLSQCDPTSEAYSVALRNMSLVTDQIYLILENEIRFKSTPTPATPKSGTHCDVQSEPVVEEEAVAEEQTEEEAPAPAPSGDDKNIPSKESVRERLAFLSNQHTNLDVAALMAEMGYSKLSDIPKEKYNALLERAEAAVKGDA